MFRLRIVFLMVVVSVLQVTNVPMRAQTGSTSIVTGVVLDKTGEGNLSGGAVAGARSDQNTYMIDGGDATSNMEGGGGYNTGFVATPRAVVPTPVESLEEFRV